MYPKGNDSRRAKILCQCVEDASIGSKTAPLLRGSIQNQLSKKNVTIAITFHNHNLLSSLVVFEHKGVRAISSGNVSYIQSLNSLNNLSTSALRVLDRAIP
mmetsp:Transcript_28552/g.44416  ORF Transcript_28552/g.44416 Transcript_28552/m.44416 type:complete len:101 (-) Transcript_28552:739-1041(-)